MIFFDTHCHINFSEFDSDRTIVWKGCLDLGIKYLLIPGCFLNEEILKETHLTPDKNVVYSSGLHPWFIEKYLANCNNVFSKTLFENTLFEILSRRSAVAVGECGLDKHIDSSFTLQCEILEIHFKAAAYFSLPVILHCVGLHNDLLVAITRAQKKYGNFGGVIHGFSGSYELACEYVKRGFHIGVGGTITYTRAKKTRDAISRLPLSSLVLETDAPSMPIHGEQGRRNNPQNIVIIAQHVADMRGESISDIALSTTNNACTLFGLLGG